MKINVPISELADAEASAADEKDNFRI